MQAEIYWLFCAFMRAVFSLIKTAVACSFCSEVKLLLSSFSCHACRTPERVGKKDDEALGELIVRTYTGLRGHLNSLRQNNDLLDDYERFFTLYKGDDRQSLKERKDSVMREYTAGLKKADSELETLIKRFLADTEAWLHRQQKRTD